MRGRASSNRLRAAASAARAAACVCPRSSRRDLPTLSTASARSRASPRTSACACHNTIQTTNKESRLADTLGGKKYAYYKSALTTYYTTYFTIILRIIRSVLYCIFVLANLGNTPSQVPPTRALFVPGA
eukprot:1194348-Prorocentrum_minimum.AAC.4